MKIATWNVNGIRARQVQFLEWVERDHPDVICLQEIKASPAQVPAPLSELPGYWNLWHGAGGYSGVSLHIRRKPFENLLAQPPRFEHPTFDFENRIVQATLGRTIVASVYVPNGGKDFAAKIEFMKALKEYVAATHAAGFGLILCGDINVALTDQDVHPTERKLVIGQRPDERLLFEAILNQEVVDVGRALDPQNENLFTWWAPWRNMRQRNIGWRIDYILASTSLAQRVTVCSVLPQVGTSDHAPVVATFSPEAFG
ncbi:MAG TPA: exodeoxyribonuclease III [Abditibacteriaceae bacterium]|jgi:exodeoxyribonuclease-3